MPDGERKLFKNAAPEVTEAHAILRRLLDSYRWRHNGSGGEGVPLKEYLDSVLAGGDQLSNHTLMKAISEDILGRIDLLAHLIAQQRVGGNQNTATVDKAIGVLRESIEATEHRATRHAEHLARLETRVAKLERER